MVRRNRRNIDYRPAGLLTLIISKDEQSWESMNGVEQNIVNNADIIRTILKNNKNDKNLIKKSISNAGWLLGMESLNFLIKHADDDKTAVNIIIAASEFDTEGNTGLLDKVYDYCKQNDVPPEWAIPVIMNLNDNINDDNDEHTFVINPKGIKL